MQRVTGPPLFSSFNGCPSLWPRRWDRGRSPLPTLRALPALRGTLRCECCWLTASLSPHGGASAPDLPCSLATPPREGWALPRTSAGQTADAPHHSHPRHRLGSVSGRDSGRHRCQRREALPLETARGLGCRSWGATAQSHGSSSTGTGDLLDDPALCRPGLSTHPRPGRGRGSLLPSGCVHGQHPGPSTTEEPAPRRAGDTAPFKRPCPATCSTGGKAPSQVFRLHLF